MAAKQDDGWDLVIHSRNGQLVLAVQIKTKLNASPEWAAQFRHNIFAYEIFPQSPYFLMAFPDRFHLWTNNDTFPELREANYIIDAYPILKPYLEKAGITKDQKISAQSLEIIVASWLGEIISSEPAFVKTDKFGQWLTDSGLYDAIAGGRFYYEAVA
jgi:hypothetical protein